MQFILFLSTVTNWRLGVRGLDVNVRVTDRVQWLDVAVGCGEDGFIDGVSHVGNVLLQCSSL